jgi:hypothetical protein
LTSTVLRHQWERRSQSYHDPHRQNWLNKHGSITSINQRNKHVDIQYQFVRDCVTAQKVNFEHVSSEDQIADSLTKPLDCVITECFNTLMGVSPLDW